MNWIKNWLFERAKSTYAQLVLHISKKTIGVLVDHTAVELIEPIRQYFRKKGVEAENLVFLVFLEQKPQSEENYLFYHSKEIKWGGYALNDNIKSFLGFDYTRVYYLCTSFDPHQNLILSNCSAAFKTGTYKAGIEPYLDLTIDDEPCDALKQVQLIDNWIDKLSSHGK
ncbi:MAG: hypothetical protein IPH94_02395 [Saprospiraceae bacterium]|nr:hypothetical protein [Saprospiraceae bacterium]MBK7220212.1 hypothetical protein [Saprospiraceae bacterium]MBK8849282.1 hypothetical protein [Saprospiraceae bacterium]